MRPVLFCQASMIKKLGIDKVKATKALSFCMEFAIRYLLIPGVVETIVIVLNLEGFSAFSGGSAVKGIISTMSNLYTGRLYKLYMCSPGGAVSFVLSMLS